MNKLYMFMCDSCGFARDKSGMCPHCQIPLTMYSKQAVAEYQKYIPVEEAMRAMSEYKWYV